MDLRRISWERAPSASSYMTNKAVFVINLRFSGEQLIGHLRRVTSQTSTATDWSGLCLLCRSCWKMHLSANVYLHCKAHTRSVCKISVDLGLGEGVVCSRGPVVLVVAVVLAVLTVGGARLVGCRPLSRKPSGLYNSPMAPMPCTESRRQRAPATAFFEHHNKTTKRLVMKMSRRLRVAKKSCLYIFHA